MEADPVEPDPVEADRSSLTRLSLTELSLTDLLALGAAGVMALVAYVSLQLADLHQHRLWLVLAISLVLGLVLLAAGRRSNWPGTVRDRMALGVLMGSALVTAALTMPGFADGSANEDPGVYVAEGVQIAHSHSYSFTDPALATHGLPVQLVSPSVRFGGIWVRDRATGLIVPQFFHLQPALLATGYDAGRYLGLELVTPLCGLIGVLLLVALLRRLGTSMAGPRAGLIACAAGGLLMSVNELQTWQSRSPSSEALAQMCWLGALLGLVICIQTRWRPAAGLAGVFIGVGFLDRADGIVGLLLLAGLGAVLVVLRRWDASAWWGLVGVGLTLPLGLWQAYAGAVTYTRLNNVPSLLRLTLIVAVLYAVAVALRVLGPAIASLSRRTSVTRVIGFGVPLVVAGLLLVGLARPHLQGPILHSTGKGTVARTFDEFNVKRFAWYAGYPVLGLAVVGVAVVSLRRWTATTWIVLLATLAESAIYLYASRNSPQLLFWARRYVPSVLPGFVLLAALAVGVLAVRSRLLRVGTSLLIAGTAVWSLVGAIGVRAESEYDGSLAAASRIAGVAGASPGVFLWELAGPCCRTADRMLAAPVWLERGELSVGMPRSTSSTRISYVAAYVGRFGAGHVFVVTPGVARPGELGAFGLTAMLHETGPIRAREETLLTKPTKVSVVPVDVTVWRVDSVPAR